MTTDWFFPIYYAIIICLLESAFDHTFLISLSIYTYAMIVSNGRCNPAKFAMIHIFTFLLHFCKTRLGHIGPHLVHYFYKYLQLLIVKWRAGISFFATSAFAFA